MNDKEDEVLKDLYGAVLVFESKTQECGRSGHNPCSFSFLEERQNKGKAAGKPCL